MKMTDKRLKEKTLGILEGYRELYARASVILNRACEIRGQGKINGGNITIGSGSIYGYHINSYYGEHEYEHRSCPTKWLWTDNWEEVCRKEYEKSLERKKQAEAKAEAKAKAKAEQLALTRQERDTQRKLNRERVQFERLSKKFGGAT